MRNLSLVVPLSMVAGVCSVRKPDRRTVAGAFLGSTWVAISLLPVNAFAIACGWWSYEASPTHFLGVPSELLLGWAILWGALPLLTCPRVPVWMIAIAFLAMDLVVMPHLAPAVTLGSEWIWGELLSIAVCLVPALFLARATRQASHLVGRATLLAILMGGILGGVIPAGMPDATYSLGEAWIRLSTLGFLPLLLVGICALVGIAAVREFVVWGQGTPLPFDPPQRLVTSGPYAYIANPMQVSSILILLGFAWATGSWLLLGGAFVAFAFSVGFARWNEGSDLHARFGRAWHDYRARVRPFWVRARPFWPDRSPATLVVPRSSAKGARLEAWLLERGVRHLAFARGDVSVATYDPGDGSPCEVGLGARGRALEHVHVGWGLFGLLLRLGASCLPRGTPRGSFESSSTVPSVRGSMEHHEPPEDRSV